MKLTIDRIRKESEIIAGLENEGSIKIIGGIYDVETGLVTFHQSEDSLQQTLAGDYELKQ